MSSVSIISGVAARIKYLIHELTDSQRLLLSEMESIIKSLNAADQETKESKQFVRFELLIVQLSYDIADAVELRMILPKQKARFPKFLRRNPVASSSNGALESLTSNLINMKNILECVRVIKLPKEEGGRINISPGKARHVNEDAGVEREVREALRGSSPSPSVVCLYGGRGMGKTTLAKKVFDDARAAGEYSFRGFAWVRVDPECEPRKVFEDILQQLSPGKKKGDIRGMDEIEMIQQILMIQKEKRCLLVLEDVWALHDWNSIRVALLVGRSTKTLITTPSWEVAQMAISKAKLCTIKPLHQPQISSILKDKASFDDHELDVYGEIISSLSQGSPLFAVVLGKSFKTADEIARDQLVDEYEKNRNRVYQGENQVLDACYRILLPDELKPCLIYMGQFPKDHDIEVEKLHLLLEAEGLLSGTRNKIIFLQSVRDILEKLAYRKLVKVQEDKVSMTRMYKSCQLHDLIRNFCIFKGLNEELFEIVDFKERTKKIEASTRRLAIYLSNYKDGDAITFSSEDKGKKIRSLLIFGTLGLSERKSTWPSDINDFKELNSLRVLDFDRVDFRVGKVLRGIGKLVFLRYLSFRGCWLEDFPSSTSKLQFLETLDLRLHDDCVMIIPNNILFNMKRLRNLYFPLRYKTDQGKTKLRLHGLEMLEILVNFQTGVCDVDDLSQLRNLRILATISEGNHSNLEAVVEYSYNATNLQRSSFIIRNVNYYSTDKIAVFIKKLLECETLQSLHIEGRIEKLPQELAISPNLSEIVFDGSEFDDPTNVLRRLKNVRSLVLSNNAFVGEGLSIVFARKYFPNLRSLKLLNLQNLEKLAFHKGSMPKLSTLVVENCGNLKQVLMPKALESRLQAAERNKGDDVYSVDLTPTII